ncbi:methyltransferase domain-containing protein, partial [Candidatus Bathyarchaeota archaeon]|nr:methyltransferase domain-containing protein [Candidatus Bathyarchaeota archaeon]
YRDRAKEYEEIYEWRDPHRQEEQDLMEKTLKEVFKDRRVLDIGCGTGYWTQRISDTAENIVGIDINETVLEIARRKEYGCPTEYRVMDAYDMDFSEKFTGTLATFMLSHVSREDISSWLEHVHRLLEPGAMVFIADNTYIDGIGGRLETKPDDPNTYKLRTLNDGTQHLIVKNYFTTEELVEYFSACSKGIDEKNVYMGKCFWWINYQYEP